jgi:hypothetical protein
MPFPSCPQSPEALLGAMSATPVAIPILELATRGAVAVALGLVLALVYRGTHKGLSYSQSFTQTVVFITLIVALVMMTVRNSLATAFTLVGAMSIIRFRTVVKDTRDTAFVFAALAVGMAAGLGYLDVAAFGGGCVVALALALHASDFGALHKSEFVLRFTFDRSHDSGGYLRCIEEFARRSSLLHVEPAADGGSLRLSYDITLRKEAKAEGLAGALATAAGVSEVALLVGKNDIDY